MCRSTRPNDCQKPGPRFLMTTGGRAHGRQEQPLLIVYFASSIRVNELCLLLMNREERTLLHADRGHNRPRLLTPDASPPCGMEWWEPTSTKNQHPQVVFEACLSSLTACNLVAACSFFTNLHLVSLHKLAQIFLSLFITSVVLLQIDTPRKELPFRQSSLCSRPLEISYDIVLGHDFLSMNDLCTP